MADLIGTVDVKKISPGAGGKVNIKLIGGSSVSLGGQLPHPGGEIWIGGNGTSGRLICLPSSVDIDVGTPIVGEASGVRSKKTVELNGHEGSISLGANGKVSIFLDGKNGDIVLGNADCAEEFDISSKTIGIEPGTVMIIDNDGKLERSHKAYDRRVAGVISGASDCKPGIILGKKKSESESRVPIALVGKVNCKVDANYSAIKVGDMLTTSSTSGHAMKAANRSKAFGAVIGKALCEIKSGRSLIPILIALQ